MNDGITRSGSFGPAAELAAAHMEIERLKAENERLRTTPEMAGHTWCKLERALAAEAKIAKLEEPNFDDPLWLRNEVRRLRGVVKDLCDRILHPNGRCTCGGGGSGSCDWCLWSAVAEAAITDDEWKELDPER